MTVSLSWRVQNIVVIGRAYSKLEHSEFSSNFEFDRNMLSGTGALSPWSPQLRSLSLLSHAALRLAVEHMVTNTSAGRRHLTWTEMGRKVMIQCYLRNAVASFCSFWEINLWKVSLGFRRPKYHSLKLTWTFLHWSFRAFFKLLHIFIFSISRGMFNRMAWQWAETLVEIMVTLADIRGTTK